VSFRFQVSGFRFQVSGFRFQVSGFRFINFFKVFDFEKVGEYKKGCKTASLFKLTIKKEYYLIQRGSPILLSIRVWFLTVKSLPAAFTNCGSIVVPEASILFNAIVASIKLAAPE